MAHVWNVNLWIFHYCFENIWYFKVCIFHILHLHFTFYRNCVDVITVGFGWPAFLCSICRPYHVTYLRRLKGINEVTYLLESNPMKKVTIATLEWNQQCSLANPRWAVQWSSDRRSSLPYQNRPKSFWIWTKTRRKGSWLKSDECWLTPWQACFILNLRFAAKKREWLVIFSDVHANISDIISSNIAVTKVNTDITV